MSNLRREIDQCRYRLQLPAETRCELLQCILRDTSGTFSGVEVNVCECCCHESEPSETRWNPTIASLALDRTDQLLAVSTLDNDYQAELRTIHQRALDRIPVMSPTHPTRVHPPDRSPPVARPLDQLLCSVPLPPMQQNAATHDWPVRELSWAVGITTTAREQETLSETLVALFLAGWKDATLFVDGDCCVLNSLDKVAIATDNAMRVSVTRREPNVGGWSNFCLMLCELFHRHPYADAYLLLQDDALLARYAVLRNYIEKVMQRIGSASIASLFCSGVEACDQAGWQRRADALQYGAQAFVFGWQAVQTWLADFIHTRPVDGDPQTGIDGRIGRWALENQIPIWFPHPSLVWHLGETSTLWGDAQTIGPRQASYFLESVDWKAPSNTKRGS